MRWIWIDKFLEFESGRRAVAVKNVTLAEDHLHDHFPGYPNMPNSLIVEGLAQTGGILVGEHSDFKEKVILAKIPKAVFHFPALPGDSLIYTATVDYIQPHGAMVTATSHVGDRLQAEMEIVFAHLTDEPRAQGFFNPENFVFTMKLLGVFDVGRSESGRKFEEPPAVARMREMPSIRPQA
jgi:3-hydroxyacyl-[acyl-carrier-protein] dehydratase